MTEEVTFQRCTCDICKKIYEIKENEKNPLHVIYLPMDYCDENGSFESISSLKVEVCEGCFKDIYSILTEHYKMRYIKYGGVTIEVKGGAE